MSVYNDKNNMRNIVITILLAGCVWSLNSQGIPTTTLQKNVLIKALEPVDDYDPQEYAELLPIWRAIGTAGPEIIPLLEIVIREHRADPFFLSNAFDLLNAKCGAGDEQCRQIVLENIASIKSGNKGLEDVLTRLLGKCGQAEDAPILLDVLRKNSNILIKKQAAKSLANIGDANTLDEMRRVYAELEANEPERLRKRYQAWVNLYKKHNSPTNGLAIFLRPPPHSYLEDIRVEISNLEARVRTKAGLSSQSGGMSTGSVKADVGSHPMPQESAARGSVPLVYILTAVLSGMAAAILVIVRKRKGRLPK